MGTQARKRTATVLPPGSARSRGWVRVPLWRRVTALFGNSFRMVVLYGLRSWWRDLRMGSVAIGSLALVLLLAGFLALAGLGVAHAVAAEAGQVSALRIYTAPDATDDQVAALSDRLKADPRIDTVHVVTADEALAQAQGRPGLGPLAQLATSNPFPASVDVQVRRVTDVGAVATDYASDPAADPAYPTSYDPNTYSRLRQWTLIAGAIVGGLALLFAFVAYTVAANAMRAVALGRRDEVGLMRLLAARGWMLRGPFLVEGFTTGALAGLVAAALVGGAWLLTERFAAATYAEVLPGVGRLAIQDLAAGIIVGGLALGSLTAWNSLRRLAT
jgi:cell division transport system permease protein